MATLIFPALNRLALEYLHNARDRGEKVIGAASVFDSQMDREFGGLALLPYVYDPDFPGVFLDFVRSNAIDLVYAPVASVYAFLEDFIAKQRLPLQLAGTSPIRQQVEEYRRLRDNTETLLPFISACAGSDRTLLAGVHVQAIFRYAAGVYGESNDDKLAAMIGIFCTAPRGDVVEIGSLMGKSACVLSYLANHYDIGSVLSVDPLSPETSLQREFPAVVQNAMDNQWDYTVLREAFIINLLPLACRRFNYLRMTSQDGFNRYRSQRQIRSAEFGTVSYSGQIAVIHIDGNHDFAHVEQDCRLWLQTLVPGAWLILDDYLWAHGDGPYRVGNALLESRCRDIERAFVCGKALFIKFAGCGRTTA